MQTKIAQRFPVRGRLRALMRLPGPLPRTTTTSSRTDDGDGKWHSSGSLPQIAESSFARRRLCRNGRAMRDREQWLRKRKLS
jgi:hypothetical protein